MVKYRKSKLARKVEKRTYRIRRKGIKKNRLSTKRTRRLSKSRRRTSRRKQKGGSAKLVPTPADPANTFVFQFEAPNIKVGTDEPFPLITLMDPNNREPHTFYASDFHHNATTNTTPWVNGAPDKQYMRWILTTYDTTTFNITDGEAKTETVNIKMGTPSSLTMPPAVSNLYFAPHWLLIFHKFATADGKFIVTNAYGAVQCTEGQLSIDAENVLNLLLKPLGGRNFTNWGINKYHKISMMPFHAHGKAEEVGDSDAYTKIPTDEKPSSINLKHWEVEPSGTDFTNLDLRMVYIYNVVNHLFIKQLNEDHRHPRMKHYGFEKSSFGNKLNNLISPEALPKGLLNLTNNQSTFRGGGIWTCTQTPKKKQD